MSGENSVIRFFFSVKVNSVKCCVWEIVWSEYGMWVYGKIFGLYRVCVFIYFMPVGFVYLMGCLVSKVL